MLQLDQLDVLYGKIQALRSVSLDLQRGEVVAVLGANGAGKTTMLKAISQLVPINAGSICFEEQRIDAKSAEDIVRRGIAQVPEGRRIFSDLSVADNLALGAYAVRAKRYQTERAHALTQVYELFPRLLERRDQKGGSLSGGEQQMLAIGRALMTLPRLLMLDEPSLGLAPVLVGNIYAALTRLKESGLTMLIVEQNVAFARMLADKAIVLANGRVVAAGPFEELAAKGAFETAYLGHSAKGDP
ncbi:branched-chain amino acid transport system ATP-binding protein [Rhodoligotrophos appendicifer]|uniref:ABC transporter ATP-binding protein n=1 Tax=Rhodoligotrophos appendicifer TaxID=987056 RepID=UPI001960D29E|nr:ABC transporter ATP-binding protein [Rhodoligotrophos appendicifer]